MALTPILSTTAEGLLSNNCIGFNPALVQAYNAYLGSNTLESIMNSPDVDGGTKNEVVKAVTPVACVANYYGYSEYKFISFSGYVAEWGALLLGVNYGENTKYISNLQTSMSYMSSVNDTINSSVSSLSVAKSTFTSSEDLITGGISAVSNNPNLFGDDLANTGRYINFEYIMQFGTPYAIIKSLIDTNAIRLLADKFDEHNIDIADLADAVNNSTGSALLPNIQYIVYQVLLSTSGQLLSDILLMMNVNTKNINTLNDLTILKKVFPNSYNTLQVLNNAQLELIVDNGMGNYTSALEVQVVAGQEIEDTKINLAFGHSMQQLKNILTMETDDVIDLFVNIETTDSLGQVNALTEPLNTNVVQSTIDNIANGRSTNNTFYLSDFIGTPSGYVHTDSFNALSQANDHGLESALSQVLAGGDVSAVQASAAAILADPSFAVWELAYWKSIEQVIIEQRNIEQAGISLYTPELNESVVNAFVESLHSYSSRTEENDMVQILEKVAQPTLSGEALIASMIEGRNLQKLDIKGIKTDSRV